MKRLIKNVLGPFIPQFISDILRKKRINEWTNNGCPVPPPHFVKQVTIEDYQKKSQYNILIETGTFMGDMVEAQKRKFKKVFSIELSKELFEKATKRFKKDKNVTIVQGDSGKVLHKILATLNEPAIFWLDGHYSSGVTAKGEKDCPIFEELDAIFDHTKFNHVLLIDDARFFIGESDYPTIDELTQYVKNKNGKYKVEVKHDIIRYVI